MIKGNCPYCDWPLDCVDRDVVHACDPETMFERGASDEREKIAAWLDAIGEKELDLTGDTGYGPLLKELADDLRSLRYIAEASQSKSND